MGFISFIFLLLRILAGNANDFVQGFADLMSIFLIVFDGDEVLTFHCFVEFMKSMVFFFKVNMKIVNRTRISIPMVFKLHRIFQKPLKF
jgi:hypothetical protein